MFIQISKLIFRSDHNFGHILQQPCNFCKIVNGAFLTLSGIFIYFDWGWQGQLGMVTWLCALRCAGLSPTGCGWSVVPCFAVWPGVDGS